MIATFDCIRVSDIYCSPVVLILLRIGIVTPIIKHTEETIHVLFHLFHDAPVMLVNSVVMLCDVLKYSIINVILIGTCSIVTSEISLLMLSSNLLFLNRCQ